MACITKVETIHIAMPGDESWASGGTEDTLVVRITDENGLEGIGECMAGPGIAICIIDAPTAHKWSESISDLLIGADPIERTALWERLYLATLSFGRRGAAIHALSALDIALHDLAARQITQPVYKLLGGARRDRLTPYATIFPGLPAGRSLGVLMDEIGRQFERARELGYRAVKMEVLFEELADDRRLAELIREGRRMLGDDIAMALDFGYRWHDWQDARALLSKVADCDILFAEAALQHDDLAGHARLQANVPQRVCGAEFATGRFEVLDWIRIGKVAVVQPGVARAGGFTELMRIAELCVLEGVQLIPHGWATGIGAQASYHLQAAAPNVPYVEYRTHELFPSPLRRDLVSPTELPLVDGHVGLPPGPGLGVTLNEAIVERYART